MVSKMWLDLVYLWLDWELISKVRSIIRGSALLCNLRPCAFCNVAAYLNICLCIFSEFSSIIMSLFYYDIYWNSYMSPSFTVFRAFLLQRWSSKKLYWGAEKEDAKERREGKEKVKDFLKENNFISRIIDRSTEEYCEWRNWWILFI